MRSTTIGMNAFQQFALSEENRWTHDHLDELLKLFAEWPTSSPCGFIFALDEMRANDHDEEPDEDAVLDTIFGMLLFNPAMFAHHVLKSITSNAAAAAAISRLGTNDSMFT